MRGWFAIALSRRPLPISQHYLFPSATTRTLVVGLGGDDLPSTTHRYDSDRKKSDLVKKVTL